MTRSSNITFSHSLNDEVLGPLVLNESEWNFTLNIPGRPSAIGMIRPMDHRVSLHEQGLDEIRERVRWLRDHEFDIRRRVAEKMFQLMLDWHDDDMGAPPTEDQFRDQIYLEGVTVYEDRLLYLMFNSADAFSDHGIVVDLDVNNQFKHEPNLFG